MMTDKMIDEALVEILRARRALEDLRLVRKNKKNRCWTNSCLMRGFDVPLQLNLCVECGCTVYEHGSEVAQHSAAKRATLDLTRKLAQLRAGK